jgi:hypothetical protein
MREHLAVPLIIDYDGSALLESSRSGSPRLTLPETGAQTGRRECGIRACECFCRTEKIGNASDMAKVAETSFSQPLFQNAKANERPTSQI